MPVKDNYCDIREFFQVPLQNPLLRLVKNKYPVQKDSTGKLNPPTLIDKTISASD